MKNRLRDNQRSKVYEAERIIFHRGQEFKNMKDINKYVNHICKSMFWKKLNGSLDIDVKDGRGRRKPCAFNSYTIALPRWGRQEAVILHELTHTLISFNGYYLAHHGNEFAKMYLNLVRHYMGREFYLDLKTSFKKFHVHYSVKKSK